MSYDLYGFASFDRDVYDQRHQLLCDGRNCRACANADRANERDDGTPVTPAVTYDGPFDDHNHDIARDMEATA